jgi:hypothetical protein
VKLRHTVGAVLCDVGLVGAQCRFRCWDPVIRPCRWHMIIDRPLHESATSRRSMESLARVSVSRKTGAEPLTAAGADWSDASGLRGWSRSDLLDNLERGVLAEFIVATALGILPMWGTSELGGLGSDDTWRHQGRGQVGGVLQSLNQKQLSRISFETPKRLAWDADGGAFAGVAGRHAQCTCSRCWPADTRRR